MLIVGAGGLAGQLFEDLVASNMQNVVFWSETGSRFDFIREKFKVITTDEEVKEYFNTVTKSFILCVGDVATRKKVSERFKNLGGKITTFITPFCDISKYGVTIGEGSMVLNKVNMESGVTVGKECLINKRSYYGHECIIRDHCEIGPTAIISAEAEIGEGTLVGIGAIILPRVKIGKNCLVQAGAVVTKNFGDNSVISGVPAELRFHKKTAPAQ